MTKAIAIADRISGPALSGVLLANGLLFLGFLASLAFVAS